MPVKNIPDDHHFVKYLKHREYFVDHRGRIVPHPEAFHLRPPSVAFRQEDTISGVYYEWFDGDADQRMNASAHFIEMKMKRKDALIRMNAAALRKQGEECKNKRKLRVTHEPAKDCEPYAVIRGLPIQADDELCSLLATMTLIEGVDIGSVFS